MKKYSKYILPLIMLCVVIASGIIQKQKFFYMLPLCISVFVMLFQSKANRYAYLLGGLNSLIYGAVDASLGLYASAVYDVAFSFSLQIITFFNWKKHASGNSVVFKKMSVKMRAITLLAFVFSAITLFIVLRLAESKYALLDNLASLLGLLVSILTMLAYIEYSYIWILNAALGVLLKLQVVMNDASQLSHLLFSMYSFCCVIMAFINVRKLYIQQQSDATKE